MSKRATRARPRLRVSAARRGTVTWLYLGLLACGTAAPSTSTGGGVAPAAATSTGAEETAEGQPPDVAWHMRASFWDTLRARDALIEGDLAAAQRAADQLAKTDYGRLLPAEWKHWVAGLQQHAAALSIAPNLGAASQELGQMALMCGECHEVHAAGPDKPRTTPLPWQDPPVSFDERMHRHQLGIALMWDGLVQPSEKAWRSGTVTITRAPLRAPEQAAEPISPELHTRIEVVRDLAKQARMATTYQERGRVYGELIAGCAQCHFTQRPARDQ